MASKRLLVVTTTPVESELLRERVRAHAGGDEPEVKVVAPASEVSPLQWLASDEDDAREEAAAVAEGAKEAVEPSASVGEVEVGDSDPLQAIEDALRTFPADEVLLVVRPDEQASWLEEGTDEGSVARFGIPVTRLVVDGG